MIGRRLLATLTLISLTALACRTATTLVSESTPTPPPTPTPTPLPVAPVSPGPVNPNEPVFVRGTIPFTSPFFLDTTAEPFVLLEDQAGFVRRDRDFAFPLEGQAIGPVDFLDDQTLSFHLLLPAVPQGTLVDVDNNGQDDQGVQVFAVAYWSNTWGGPFLERRDGTGWSNAYASTITDPDRDDEIIGGLLIVWAPDDRQRFPTGFGPDESLFTPDDPTDSLPAGYSLIDLDQVPFRVYKQAQIEIELIEGASAVNDFTDLNYADAFQALIDKVRLEYPFTEEKGINWDALESQFAGAMATARTEQDFYLALRDFISAIPDGHVGGLFDGQVFFEERGGGFGLVLVELSDQRLIVAQALAGYPAAQAGIQEGAELLTWDGIPVAQAIGGVRPDFGPYSTSHARRWNQVAFLSRVPPGTEVAVTYRNPLDSQVQEARLEATVEYESLFLSFPVFNEDELALPVEGQVLDESGLGYIRIHSFSDDDNLMARLWERYLQDLIDNEVPGLIIDVRVNGGGNGALANEFAGYFFDEALPLYQRLYYNHRTGEFEPHGRISQITPATGLYDRPLAVLIGPDCVSACEGFVYALSQGGRALLVGHAPTAGAFGEVGRGQYELPDELKLQFPTGRPETLNGDLLIESVGVEPDLVIPVTVDSALGHDAVLEAAVEALLDEIR